MGEREAEQEKEREAERERKERQARQERIGDGIGEWVMPPKQRLFFPWATPDSKCYKRIGLVHAS